jgi:hypothetical protein
MPAQGGEGLASWIRMHDVTITQAEQQLIQSTKVIGGRMGAAALRSLAATHIEQNTAPPTASPPSSAGAGGSLVGGPLGVPNARY